MDSPRNALSPGYKLHWYTIKKTLGQGGFGITYLAEDTNLNQLVAIKEFLPIEMAVRDQSASVHPVSGEYGEQFKWGLDRFMSEAQTLAKFKHPNIVRVFTVFPENNTAYMVMEYEHGQGMHELLKNKNTLCEESLKTIIIPILDGLKKVHESGFIHRDIKPANIFIREDGSPVLLDFGSARQSFGMQTRTLTTMVSPGFAPFEQYVSKSDKQGPWTDIYGLGATMYRSVIGRSPAEAMDRSEGLLHSDRDTLVTASEINPAGYSSALLSAIDHALAFKPEGRPQSISEWLAEIDNSLSVDQSDIETVVDPAFIKNEPGSKNLVDEKTEILKRDNIKEDEKKPSLLRRAGKYALIGFAALLVLSILNKAHRNKAIDKAREMEPAVTDSIKIAEDKNISEDVPVKKELLAIAKPEEQAVVKPLTSDEDRKRISLLKNELKNNPQDKEARQELQTIMKSYESRIKEAAASGDVDTAMAYLREARFIAPNSVRLKTILKRLEQKKRQ